MRDVVLVLRRHVLGWVVVGVRRCWIAVIARLQRRWMTEVCCQVRLDRWVVRMRCCVGIMTR